MWAVDTNVLVRHYTQDDPRQAARALNWLTTHAPCFVPVTVVLELYWVLESAYGLPWQRVRGILEHLTESPVFQVESVAAVQRAIGVADAGLGFADALHWASCDGCTGLASFDDRGFARRAARLGLVPPVIVPP